MAGLAGYANRHGVDLTPATEVQMLRIVAGTNHPVSIVSITHSWNLLGSEAPIEVIYKWDPSTPGSNGTGVTPEPLDADRTSLTFDTAFYQDASGASGYDHTRSFYFGPGPVTELPSQHVIAVKAGGYLDIFHKQATGGDAGLKGSIDVEFRE